MLYQHALATQRQSTVLRANLWILVVAIIAMDANKPRLPPAQRGHKRKLAPSTLPRSKRCPSASGTVITPSPLAGLPRPPTTTPTRPTAGSASQRPWSEPPQPLRCSSAFWHRMFDWRCAPYATTATPSISSLSCRRVR